ncbi:hypothetical protein OSB04_006208 [Centaurea solstitialis]|uniref:Uncharacterized protein n=1 Tax=Centaurea solstitialis TaxID=347529 RepID=A0AA38TQ22_9ASTR|nr:hypothetical protein OSB04_006208 [Centaurea solstitialis]
MLSNYIVITSILNKFAALENLEILDLSDNYGMEGFDRVSLLKKLKVLNLGDNDFNESFITSLSALPMLKSLDLSYNYYFERSFPAKGLVHLTDLEELDLSWNHFNDTPSIQECTRLSRLKKLKGISLQLNEFNKSIISCLGALPSLKTLDLSSNDLGGSFPIQELSYLSQDLEVLLLSRNDFNGTLSFEALASFHHLEVLDLSANHFVGCIPSTIQELSSLRILSFAYNNLHGPLPDHGLCELKNLQELDLSHNMFNGSVPQCFNRLSSLTMLDISSNRFTGTLMPSPIANLTSLRYVDFGDNLFEGSFSFSSLSNKTMLEVVRFKSNNSKFEVETEEPTGWIPMFQLKVLVISGCNMNRLKGGIVPGFLLHQHELQEVDLSDNSLVGPFPNWLIESNTMLEYLDLSKNSFSGTIRMPFYVNANIRWLDMSGNHLNGTIPDDIQKFLPGIAYLNLSSNSLDGVISSSIGDMRELQALDLSDNKFSGEVPKGLFSNLYGLIILKLSKNRLQGQVLSGNLSLGRIRWLHLDSNCFTGKIGNWNISNSHLQRLDIGSMIPHWISNMSGLSELVVRNNSFKGQFPCGTASFTFLDISNNYFSGPFPSCLNFIFMRHLHLGSNILTGSIPNVFRNLSSILTLDIGDNFLSGRIPEFHGNLSNLRILILRNNNFSGPIPKQLCQLSDVSLIDLSGNSLSGSIPSCLHNVIKPSYPTFIEEMSDQGSEYGYKYESVLYKVSMVSSLWVDFEVAEEVQFTTKSLSYLYKGQILDLMVGLDLSCNRLTGEIPEELGLLTQIHALNLSHNQLYGPIPVNFSNLANIESLDLSSNNLSGEVPSELVKLNTLSVFNVSYNNLSGRLPEMRGQFATFSKESYEGNPLLCGPPLEKNCTATSSPQVTSPSSKEEDDKWYDIDFLASFCGTWVVFMLGFAAVLYINPYWRRRWLEFVEECIVAAKMECWYVSKMKYSWLMMMMIIGSVMVSGIEGGCIQEERNALLQIKTSLIDLYGLDVDHFLPSWVDDGRECCDWERVMCNTTIGHVTDLSLRNVMGIPDYQYYDTCRMINWPLNVSVFLHFEELTSLNLSRNCLDDGIVNTGLGRLSSLKKLQTLDLSRNGITDATLPSLGALTSLRVLNLGYNLLEGYFPALGMSLENLDILDLSSNYMMQGFDQVSLLKKLKVLNLRMNRFNESFITSLSALPMLKSLDLSANYLLGRSFPAKELAHLTNLEELDLSHNYFNDTPSIQECMRLSRLKKLKSIRLQSNEFNKSIISCLGALPSLKSLDLSFNGLGGSFPIQELSCLSQDLEVLLLSGNDFNGTLSFEALASFHHLEVLDLSWNNFVGSIPSTIQELSSLRVLSFAGNNLNGSLRDHGLCELKNLQELDLSHNMFNGSVPQCFNRLSSLTLLDISSNRFTGMLMPSPIANLTSLKYVDFGDNLFEGSFSFSSLSNKTMLAVVRFESNNSKFEVETEEPTGWIPMFQLKVLVISGCNMNRLNGSIVPGFLLHQHELLEIDLSDNSLVGPFPNWLIESNTMLEYLILNKNSFSGTIRMPFYVNANIRWLDMSGNQLNGTIPDDIQKFLPGITYLNLSSNSLDGVISSSIGDMRELWALDLSDNKFSGEVPKGLFSNLSYLIILKLSKNKLQGQVLSGNLSFGYIKWLHLDSNYFTGKIGNWNISNSYLRRLDIGSMIPHRISNMSCLSELVVRDNSFEGQFPCGTASFSFLDISHNYFSGPLPSCSNFQFIRHLHLGSNRLTGSIPNVFRDLTYILTLDIGDNFLSGRIPEFRGNLSNLRILILRNNNFSGPIPKQLCQLSDVSLIDLSGNSLSGFIPSCLHNIIKPLYPTFIEEMSPTSLEDWYEYESVLYKVPIFSSVWVDREVAEEVQFTTKSLSYPYKGQILDLMVGLDLSCNRLTGEIPEELGLLNQIHSLNLSHNQLYGPIPVNFSNLANIESLDLSSNHLSGEVPSGLIQLHYLSTFNVSYNNLSGKLPDMKAQFNTFPKESYEGNLLLCGPPLEKNCSATSSQVNDPSAKEGPDEWYDIDFLASFFGTWVVSMLGFAGVLYVNPYWRRRWLEFVEECMYTCYYFLEDSLRKVSRVFFKKIDLVCVEFGSEDLLLMCWCVSKMKYSWLLLMVTVYGIEGGCIEEERNALLQIKTSLVDSYAFHVAPPLPSWVDDGGECCDWERVNCNSTTGHVIDLSLRNIASENKNWPLNVSVFLHFKELTSLNLSWNNLDDGIVNTGLGRFSSLKKLHILDLSDNSITNVTFPSLSALTSLRVLNLGYNRLEGYFPALGMGGFKCEPLFDCEPLENLEILDLSYNFEMKGFDQIFQLKNLKVLNLGGNEFNESFITSLNALPMLKSLDLNHNHHPLSRRSFPVEALAHLTNLEELDLSGNSLSDTPSIQECTRLSRLEKLTSITLGWNYFNKSIISCLSALPSLNTLDLSFMQLEGSFPIQALLYV